MTRSSNDADANKGAIEQDHPGHETNTTLSGQLPHRNENPAVKSSDTDFPEPGENAEHSGEPRTQGLAERDGACEPRARNNPEGQTQNQDPGQQQKQNQGGKKDDPLAA
jgi:hypothetical protein